MIKSRITRFAPLAFVPVVTAAWGATYNFYFNNTEQGANSTANPTVTVSDDGKVVKKTGGEAVTPAAPSDLPGANSAVAGTPTSTTTAAAAAPAEAGDPRWRITLGAQTYKMYGPDGPKFFGSENIQPALGVSYSFNRDVALAAYGAILPDLSSVSSHWMAGAEIELTPIHITLGRFENLIEVGLLAGLQAEHTSWPGSYTSTYNYNTYYTYAQDSNSSTWTIRPTGGVRVALNLGRNWGVTSNVRANADYATGEVALALRF